MMTCLSLSHQDTPSCQAFSCVILLHKLLKRLEPSKMFHVPVWTLVCSHPAIIHYLFSFSVLKMFEVVNNICALVPVIHRMVIVYSIALFCRSAELKQPALKATFLMSHAFWIISKNTEGCHQERKILSCTWTQRKIEFMLPCQSLGETLIRSFRLVI